MNKVKKLALIFLMTAVLHLGDAQGTKVPGKPRQIQLMNLTCNSITIAWEQPSKIGQGSRSEIQYEIFRGKVKDGVLLGNVTGINETHLSSLQPNTLYKLRVRARNAFGTGLPSSPKSVTTENITLSEVIIISNEFSGNTTTVTVEIQNINIFRCYITSMDNSIPIMEIDVHIYHNITNLNPNTTYTMDCRIEGNMCTKAKGTFTTVAAVKVPSRVTNVLDHISCNSIMVSWDPPRKDGGSPILDYHVTLSGKEGELRKTVLTGGNTTVSFFNLMPKTKYSVHIRAKNSVGLGLPYRLQKKTEKIGKIYTTKVVITSNSINFTLNGTIMGYMCTLTSQDVIAMQLMYRIRSTGVFSGLLPNTNYNLNCEGIEDNCSVSTTSFRTGVGAPDPPAIKVKTANCTSISLSLTLPNITGGKDIQKYIITWYTSAEEHLKTRMEPGDSSLVTLTGLSPNTTYTINVSSSNLEVTGHAARITYVTAKRNATDQRNLIVSNISATSLQLSHSLGEQIQYSCRVNKSGSQPFNVSKDEYPLNGLQPDTIYTITCVAYHNGIDFCLEVNTKTKTLPGKVIDLKVNGLGHVESKHIHQSISWNRPQNHKSPLNYSINYRRRDSENGLLPLVTNMTTSKLTFPIDQGLQYMSHKVQVSAVSDAGQGAYRIITIEYKGPSAPKAIRVVNGTLTCNSISLQWLPPDNTGGLPIMKYSISVKYKQFRKMFSGQQTDVVLRNLLPEKLYSIKVKAENAIYSGETQATSVTTESRSQFGLQFQPYSSTKAHLIITPPGKLNKDGIIYSCTLAPRMRILTNVNEHNITLDNLKANTTYNVTCLAYSDSQEELCYEGKANGRTFPSVPEIAPTNVTVTSTSSVHFTVKWDLPVEYINDQDIEGYSVEYWEKGFMDSNNTSITVHREYNATGLGAGKVYLFQVAAFTAHGIGTYSTRVEIAAIPTVQNIIILRISSTSALVKWKNSYETYIIWFVLSVNDNFLFGQRSFAPKKLTNKAKQQINNLDPFRSYTLNIYLQLNNQGNGSTVQQTFKTLGIEPTEPPARLSVVSDKHNATLNWEIPPVSGRNGIITRYTIEWTSRNQQTSPQTTPINYTVSNPNFTHPARISSALEGLSPYTNYTWRVAAININGTGPFSMWNNFSTDEDAPDRVEHLRVTRTTDSSIMVKWIAPSKPNGIIIAYSICYWTLGDKCTQPMNVSNPNTTKESIRHLDPGVPYRISVTAFTSAGQGEDNIHDDIIFSKELPPNRTVTGLYVNWTNPSTVNIGWTPLTVHEARGFPTYRVNITSEGRAIRSKLTNDSHLSVGGLDQTKMYSVSVQPLTNGGKAPGETSEFVSFGSPNTQSTFPVWIVIIVVLLILAILICLVILIIIVLFCKYKRQQKAADLMEEVLSMKEVVAVVDDSIVAHHNMQMKEPIPKHLFCEHVRKMHHNKDDRFKTEFGDITKEPPVSKEASETNRQRNRYINIYPYDYSRVVLSDSDGSDYVNAAFLDGHKSPKRYIASQGPTPLTTADFWEMIWEQKTTVIVMLTRLVEGTRIKCEQYWNEEMNATYEPGRNLRVTMTSNKVMTGFEVRQFRVEKTSTKSDPIKVKHFLYTAWPDHGVPQYTSSMVKFILHQYKPEVKDSATPIVVHCSAGAGRTGTFVAIDTAIDRLAEEDDINIFECVELMRARRTQMVQNVSQYIYIHDAINDYVTCGETAIVAHELGQKKSEMKKTDPNTNKTGFEQLFKLLQETSAEVCDDDKEFSRRQDIAERNRYKTRYPYSDNFIQTEDDETYINATEIKGYYGQGTFIAAQAPMKNTIEDTWNVIRQQNCSVVVVLTNFEEQSQEMCAEFWPGEVGVPMEIGYMKISLTNTVHNEQFDEHKLSISVEEADIVNKVDVYHYKAWMKHSSPDVPSLLKLMGDVQRSHQGSSGPLMVMCDDGMSRTGVFITVMSEIDRVKVEGEMDIFHTVKAARTDRPHMVSTVGDYECCHEILQQYLESFDTYANFK